MTASMERALGKIIVTGAGGQLGGELCRILGDRAIGWTRAEWDLQDTRRVRDRLRSLRPTAVINCAAYTKVDLAEQEQHTCFQVNGQAVAELANFCADLDCALLQVSSDYVFGQDKLRSKPYRESDVPGPQGVYAQSKLAGEQAAQQWKKHFVIRTCGLYSRIAGGPVRGRNFVDTMLAVAGQGRPLRVVGDQFCTPSYVPHVARAIAALLTTDDYGIYHITNDGFTNWHEFAEHLFALADIHPSLEKITSVEYPTPAARPAYSVLACDRYGERFGYLPDWREGLQSYLSG